MSHPDPSREYGENEYPDKGYRPVGKKAGHSKRQESSVGSKLMKMASRLKGLQETKHFGAKRRARHLSAKKAKLTGSKIPF